jgi:hypothetical protein
MIDGFYNCTALLDDPRRSRTFRISGLFRKRDALKADETKFSNDPAWEETLRTGRQAYEQAMRADGFTDALTSTIRPTSGRY